MRLARPQFLCLLLLLNPAGEGAVAANAVPLGAAVLTDSGGMTARPRLAEYTPRDIPLLFRSLNLSPEQVRQIHALMLQVQPEMRALDECVRVSVAAVAASDPHESTYPALTALARSYASVRKQAMSAARIQVLGVLSSAQRSRVRQLAALETVSAPGETSPVPLSTDGAVAE